MSKSEQALSAAQIQSLENKSDRMLLLFWAGLAATIAGPLIPSTLVTLGGIGAMAESWRRGGKYREQIEQSNNQVR